MSTNDDAPTWADVDDHGEPGLLAEWRAVQDNPPLGVVTVDVPKDFCALGRECPQ